MPKKLTLSPPQTNNMDYNTRGWFDWFSNLFNRIGEGPFLIQGYSVANLPAVSDWGNIGSADPFSALIFIRDETGGATLAFSDGTDWRRVQDRAIVA